MLSVTKIIVLMVVELNVSTEHWWNDTDRIKQRYLEEKKKTCPRATLFTTNPMWIT
jgi:hypothetical protein